MSPFDDEEEDTHVGDLPDAEEVSSDDVLSVESIPDAVPGFASDREITKPHDAEDWLKGFHAGHRGLRLDYLRATRLWARAFGFTDEKSREIMVAIAANVPGEKAEKIVQDVLAMELAEARNKKG